MTTPAPLEASPALDPRTDIVLKRLMQLHPKSIDLSLGRVQRLLDRLGNPERDLPPVIHLAGTNGKGSVLAYMASALTAAGLRAHAYTSPHLVRFAERIRLSSGAGQPHPITESWLVDLLEECERANGGAPITFFEITTAAAFLAFARTPGDYVLLETGLGGRLDATNVVEQPAVCVITPISIDHQSFLGETLPEIAGEKAGILKTGVAAVIGDQPAEALDVIEARATAIGATLDIWGQDYDAFEQHGRLVYQDANGLLDLPLPRLFGRHQVANAGIAIAALRTLSPPRLSEAELAVGLETAQWPARLERLAQGRLHDAIGPDGELWLDGGHNVAAGVVIAAAMADLEDRVSRPLRLIVGMMAGKDIDGFLESFSGLADGVVAVPIPDQENARPPEDVAAAAARVGLTARIAGDIETALKMAGEGGEPVRILITGSLYLAGHVLALHRGYAIEPAR